MVLFSEAWQAASVPAETRIIPSAYTNGRYDSNIFVAPTAPLPPGQQKEDMVGIVGGDVVLDRWVEQLARGARLTLSERFMYTPGIHGIQG